MTSAAAIPTVSLNDENTIPVIGLGVGELSEAETEQAVSAALEAGYRLIDTAAAYGNEAGVGRAIAASGVPRAELFVTTKLAIQDLGFQASQDACKASLERLGLDYVDLYLIHWPAGESGTYVDSWGGLMKSREAGDTRSIGVGNFTRRAPVDHHRPDVRRPGGQSDRTAPAAESGRAARGPCRARHRHRGLQPAGRRQAAGQPDRHLGRRGARQVPGTGADPLEHPAGQRRHPPFDIAGAHRARTSTCSTSS